MKATISLEFDFPDGWEEATKGEVSEFLCHLIVNGPTVHALERVMDVMVDDEIEEDYKKALIKSYRSDAELLKTVQVKEVTLEK